MILVAMRAMLTMLFSLTLLTLLCSCCKITSLYHGTNPNFHTLFKVFFGEVRKSFVALKCYIEILLIRLSRSRHVQVPTQVRGQYRQDADQYGTRVWNLNIVSTNVATQRSLRVGLRIHAASP